MNEQGFAEIYARYQDPVRRFLHGLGAGEDVDDLVQDTFLKVFRNLESFADRSTLKTWIFSVAVNCYRDLCKKKRRKHWLGFFADKIDEIEAHEALNSVELEVSQVLIDKELARSCLASLSPKLREVVILSYYQDCDLQEIADVLKIPLGTVKSRLNEARAKLQKAFGKDLDP